MYGPIDAELVLRAASDGAETATGAEAGISLALVALGDFRAVFSVSALDRATGDETYVLSVDVAALADFSDALTIGVLPAVTATGAYELPLSGALIRQHKPTARHIRCKHTLGGTTPGLTYGCHLAPSD